MFSLAPILIGVIIEWQFAINRVKYKLNNVRKSLDAAEPDWQLDELNGRRNANLPPDERNVAIFPGQYCGRRRA